jgi:ubiquinol-cytochrome c reductase cytochrome c subunit
MLMTPRILVLIAAAVGLVSATATLRSAQAATGAQSTAAANAKRVESGEALYKKKGCYECHVQEAQGGPQGPRLGPNPIPLPRFTTYVRNPAGEMPPFTERVLSTRELEDIYAFLQARPQPKPVASLPQLAP